MKKRLIAFALPMLFAAVGTAQTEQLAPGTKYPNHIKLEQKASVSQQEAILKTKLQMTADDQLRALRKETDEVGYTHEKFQQLYRGVKVDGAEFSVHSKDGQFDLMTGDYWKIADLDVKPAITASVALNAALTFVGARQYAWDDAVKAGFPEYSKPQGELVIVADPEGQAAPRLAYKFDIYATEPLYRAHVYVDARTAAVFQEHPLLFDANVPATGNSLYNGSVPFTADFTGTLYRLRQTAMGSGIQTFNLNHGTNYNTATDFTSATANFTADGSAVNAHWGAERTYSYYQSQHGRNSYNNAGGLIKSYVHYSNNYVNAFWDGTRMTYGDGDGVTYSPLVSLDICGHEITHGVTQYSANLTYSNESGALNESFSDIFGEAIENYAAGPNDWLMGADIFISGSGAIRNMADPNQYADPDTYHGTYWYSGTADNGGVHTNSGVQNKWFYILAHGEAGTNDLGNAYNVAGIGIASATAIAYRNLTVYLSPSSNYAAARAGAIQAARDLFGVGSAEETATTDAWYAVGVGAASGGGGGGGPLLGSYFETGWDNWTDGGVDCARYSGSNSYEGSYSIQLRDNSGTASAMTSPALNVSGYTQLAVQFYFRAVSMEAGEDFWLQYFNGSTWTTVATYTRGVNFNNNTFYTSTVTLTSAQYTFPTNAQFRFMCDASDDTDQIYIDAVTVTGSNTFTILGDTGGAAGAPQIAVATTAHSANSSASNASLVTAGTADAVILFPNPVTNLLRVQASGAIKSIQVFAADGSLIVADLTVRDNSVDLSSLTPGFYFISVETENAVVRKKIIKK